MFLVTPTSVFLSDICLLKSFCKCSLMLESDGSYLILSSIIHCFHFVCVVAYSTFIPLFCVAFFLACPHHALTTFQKKWVTLCFMRSFSSSARWSCVLFPLQSLLWWSHIKANKQALSLGGLDVISNYYYIFISLWILKFKQLRFYFYFLKCTYFSSQTD